VDECKPLLWGPWRELVHPDLLAALDNDSGGGGGGGRGLHSSNFLLNLSRFGHTSPLSPV